MQTGSPFQQRWLTIACATAVVFGSVVAQGAPASKSDAKQVMKAASQIDKLLAADWQKHGITPNAPIGDEQFVRRVYLDVAGRVPSYDEVTRFLESKDRNKRAKLIDELLDSEAYVSNFYNYWADVLRVKTRLPGGRTGIPYQNWIKQSLRDNMPYDQFVRELITAEGSMYDNGATGYFIRDSGMPLDNLSNTVRIFLGTQIGCAQCHDHPFDKWSQYEFYEMAAFTYGVRTRQRPSEGMNPRDFRKKIYKSDLDNKTKQLLFRMLRNNSHGVAENKYVRLKLPDDYKYDDAKPKEVVEPATIFGKVVRPERGDSNREAFAKWMTGKDNPRFATVIANRLWERAFGVGVVPQFDDIRDDTVATNPPLMQYLSDLIKYLDFDMKAYMRVVLNTRAYQREATYRDIRSDETYRFPGPMLRRMRAEQVWDSYLTLAMPAPDHRESMRNKAESYGRRRMDITGKTPDEVIAMAKDFANKDPRKMRMQMFREVMQKERPDPKYRGFNQGMFRASELESPAPPGHFLREFGQSDRELIEGSNDEPSVTQVLTLMNGTVDKVLLAKNSVLRRNLESAKSAEQRIDVIFLSILGRNPQGLETRMAKKQIDQHGDKAYGDLVWALINTREFMFVQ